MLCLSNYATGATQTDGGLRNNMEARDTGVFSYDIMFSLKSKEDESRKLNSHTDRKLASIVEDKYPLKPKFNTY
jgi:hypothetical protein